MEDIDLDELRSWSLAYLASPYSKYTHGIDNAYVKASMAAGWLMRQGVKVFCPISHSHPIAVYGGVDPVSHEIWLPADKPFMRAAAGLVVLMLDGWRDSHGIQYEMAYFTAKEKPIRYMEWPR